ncbi:MAG: hypothetical protein JNM69_42300 [Archangium sp.]|nr:hypothetical protein [Archangium sp.]
MFVAALFWKMGSGDFSEVWWSNELPVMAFSTLVPAWMDVERLSRLGWFDAHQRKKAPTATRAKVADQLSIATGAARLLVGAFAVTAITLTVAFYGEKFHVGGFAPGMPAKKQMGMALAGLVSGGILVRGYLRWLTREP